MLVMDEPSTFGELIALWPSRAEFAADLGVQLARVHKWAQNNSIPAVFWLRLLNAAAEREIAATADLLVKLAAPNEGLEAA